MTRLLPSLGLTLMLLGLPLHTLAVPYDPIPNPFVNATETALSDAIRTLRGLGSGEAERIDVGDSIAVISRFSAPASWRRSVCRSTGLAWDGWASSLHCDTSFSDRLRNLLLSSGNPYLKDANGNLRLSSPLSFFMNEKAPTPERMNAPCLRAGVLLAPLEDPEYPQDLGSTSVEFTVSVRSLSDPCVAKFPGVTERTDEENLALFSRSLAPGGATLHSRDPVPSASNISLTHGALLGVPSRIFSYDYPYRAQNYHKQTEVAVFAYTGSEIRYELTVNAPIDAFPFAMSSATMLTDDMTILTPPVVILPTPCRDTSIPNAKKSASERRRERQCLRERRGPKKAR